MTEADFMNEFNLAVLSEHPFMLDNDEIQKLVHNENILKLLKM